MQGDGYVIPHRLFTRIRPELKIGLLGCLYNKWREAVIRVSTIYWLAVAFGEVDSRLI